ncbi:MAG: hypothetical protein KBT87_07460 [Gammaproteobacteria bacterium]|nr:hypothetical protein [Gammaproteobacteria bacterium]MBQ0774489.1 hypothetical protein [Gammaproteobacteria bacterium]
MVLKPQDLLVLLKIIAKQGDPWSYNGLAVELGMSPAEVHAGIKRAIRARLALKSDRGAPARPVLRALEEFILHGMPYVFIAEQEGMTRGIATAWAAPMMSNQFIVGTEPPPVWPHPEGKTRGQGVSPLYKSAPFAAMQDVMLYELLALVDMLRIGRAREKELAVKHLKPRLEEYRQNANAQDQRNDA